MAASAALAEAGIEMFGLVVATSACSLVPSVGKNKADLARMDVDTAEEPGPQILLDPTGAEDARAMGNVTLACMPALGSITNVRQTGSMSAKVAAQVRLDLFLFSASSFPPFAITGFS